MKLYTPYEAKRLDATHAVIYDSNGMLVARTGAAEDAFATAQEIANAVNTHRDLVNALFDAVEHLDMAQSCIESGRDQATVEAAHTRARELLLRVAGRTRK